MGKLFGFNVGMSYSDVTQKSTLSVIYDSTNILTETVKTKLVLGGIPLTLAKRSNGSYSIQTVSFTDTAGLTEGEIIYNGQKINAYEINDDVRILKVQLIINPGFSFCDVEETFYLGGIPLATTADDYYLVLYNSGLNYNLADEINYISFDYYLMPVVRFGEQWYLAGSF